LEARTQTLACRVGVDVDEGPAAKAKR